ncbi:MAG: molybdopterin-binding protein, partial [Gammaproteobacteria bacterium]|nr:molybdopterin-binding protein [Gammaproteobacteria bacterium]
MSERKLVPVNIAVMTVSDSRTEENDTSGKVLVERLTEAGHQCAEKIIVIDDIYKIREVISRWIADDRVNIIITTG